MAVFDASTSRVSVNMNNREVWGLSAFSDVVSTPAHTSTLFRELLENGFVGELRGSNIRYDSTSSPGFYFAQSGSVSGVSLYDASGSTVYSISQFSTTLEHIAFVAVSAFDIDWVKLLENVVLIGNDSVTGSANSDVLNGFGGNDVFRAGRGNDTVNGGSGVDTVVYARSKADFTITKNTSTYTVADKTFAEGTDSLSGIERIKFNDAAVAFDTSGNAGQAYRMYQAAFDRKPDLGGLGAQINGMDNGLSLLQIAQNFMDSAEFKLKYGASQSNGDFVTQLYQNVLHRAPDADGYAHQVNAINSGTVTRAQLLVNFSESPENQAAVIGVIQNGIDYVPFA